MKSGAKAGGEGGQGDSDGSADENMDEEEDGEQHSDDGGEEQEEEVDGCDEDSDEGFNEENDCYDEDSGEEGDTEDEEGESESGPVVQVSSLADLTEAEHLNRFLKGMKLGGREDLGREQALQILHAMACASVHNAVLAHRNATLTSESLSELFSRIREVHSALVSKACDEIHTEDSDDCSSGEEEWVKAQSSFTFPNVKPRGGGMNLFLPTDVFCIMLSHLPFEDMKQVAVSCKAHLFVVQQHLFKPLTSALKGYLHCLGGVVGLRRP